VHRLETTFVGRCLRHFVALQGIDRAVVLSSQAFTALIPLLLLVTALAPADDRDVVAAAIIRRFRLSGGAADAVGQLFAHSGDSATGVLSVFLLFFSGVSLTRRLQRMYQQAWGLEPPPGVGRALNAALGLSVLVLGISLLYVARTLVGSLPAGAVLVTPVSVLASFLLWTSVPWLLLDRRITWRRLIPVGALTAACASVYGVASTFYMPRLLETYSERYGLFGVTLALIGWLLGIALIVVAATVVASAFDRAQDPWARRVRRMMHIEPAAVGGPPLEKFILGESVPLPTSSGRPLTESSPAPVNPPGGTAAANLPEPGSPEPGSPARNQPL
jgi:membrane protein